MCPSSAPSSRPRPAALLGGRYVVERVLGEGGMGRVYAVLDRGSGSRLALKRLKPDAGERVAALFEREYRILAGLRHPCIVEVYDYGIDAEGPYYTMELVAGSDLSTRAPVPWRTACAYLRDAASILGLLHARRLLHRDIAPRNLIETEQGRLKLIDFGALSNFGTVEDVAGTPPFIPPEALNARQLDQRSDVFALGALGYWLITGSHAFPARSLAELPELWCFEPPPASVLVQRIGSDLLEPPPAMLDDLLAMLLRIDPRERIASTAELLDRLSAIAEIAPEAADDAVRGYLHSSAFVGRERERELLQAALDDARRGHGRAVLIEAEAGAGRSRLLEELAVTARLAGALALSGDAAAGPRAYALAGSLLSQLQRALPSETRALAAPHSAVLAPLAVQRDAALPKTLQAVGESRARLQSALLDVFCGIAQTHFLTLLIDDLHAIDTESLALLGALVRSASALQLCTVASAPLEPGSEAAQALHGFRGIATRVRLPPLTAAETRNLLRSVFGEVAYLDRSSERLHRSSQGNPAHCLELAQHLVQIGAAKYAEGSWTLPAELSPDSLPQSRRAGQLLRLERLPAAARTLAAALSVSHGGSWELEHAACAAQLQAADARAQLEVLVRERVLRVSGDGYVFGDEAVREQLHGELSPTVRRALHRRLAMLLESGAALHEPGIALRVCAHWLRADELERAYPLLKRALAACLSGDPAHIALHAAAFEEIYQLLVQANQDEYALCGPLGMLAVAGYFADRRYAVEYGERALSSLRTVLELPLGERLAARVGRKLALGGALAAAAARMALHRSRCLSLAENVQIILLAASTLAGTAAICIDPERAARYAKSIELFTAFGRWHIATLIHDFAALMSLQGRDRPARSSAALRAMIERLEDPRPIRDLTEIIRASYYAGAHLTLGVFVVRRDDRAGLALADKLERFSPLYAMSADHLRSSYYAGQGEQQSAEAWRRKLEIHAVQLGSAWQVETWAPVDVINIAWRMHDAFEMKRAMQELGRLSAQIPSLAIQELNARIGYLVLRGKYTEALELAAASDEPPFAYVGWMRTQSALAYAHNALGQHDRARAICLEALQGADPGDLEFTVMNLGVPIELALAEAGLGHFQLAHRQLQTLFAAHASNHSAVSLGMIQEARARVSLLERDYAGAREHLRGVLEDYSALGIVSLLGRARALERQIDRAEDPSIVHALGAPLRAGHARPLLTRVRLLLRERAIGEQRASGSLQVALELCGADSGFLVLADAAEVAAAHSGEPAPSDALVAWAREALWAASPEDATVVSTKAAREHARGYRVVGDVHYRAFVLWAPSDRGEIVAGVVVIASEGTVPDAPEPEVLRAIAGHLVEGTREVRSG